MLSNARWKSRTNIIEQDEFHDKLQEPLILAILNDYDLSVSGDEIQARETLESLAATAEVEEVSAALDLSSVTSQQDDTSCEDRVKQATTDTSVSAPHSSYYALAPAPCPNGLQPFEAVHALEALPNSIKEERILTIFPALKPHDVSFALKNARGDVCLALEELLTAQYLEATSQRLKGIDAFAHDEDPHHTFQPKGKQARKKPKKLRRNLSTKRSLSRDQSFGQESSGSACCSSVNSDNEATSDLSGNTTLQELTWEQRMEVRFLATRVNLAEIEVTKVYLACDFFLPATINSLVEAFFRIGYVERRPSLQETIDILRPKYPGIPKDYIPCITYMTENITGAEDIAGVLTQIYAKPGQMKLKMDNDPKPVFIETDEPQPSVLSRSSIQKPHVNKPGQPTMPVRRLPSSSNPSPVPLRPESGVWKTVGRKTSGGKSSPVQPFAIAAAGEHFGTSRDSAFAAAVEAFQRGSSNHALRQEASVYSGRHVALNNRPLKAAEVDDAVAATSDANSIDLHGVHVTDGVRIAKQAIADWWKRLDSHPMLERMGKTRLAKEFSFQVVTGRGRHSAGGQSKLRPPVLSALDREGWNVQVRTGSFIITGKK